MELTVEQALQQGVTAHKEGKLQEAERLYRAIMQTQPLHPDANHNLGVLAVSMNKADEALSLFKTALEVNPKIEQFWLSYIDALIKEKQFENANQVLEKAKKQGVDGERLNSLEAQLLSKTQKSNIEIPSPPEELLNNLLGYYQNGRFSDAERLSVEITQDFPKHQFAWKVLGTVLGEMGRKSEAANINQTVVELSPQDSEAHNNLGITLKELGRLDEAEVSYRQAIALKPDYAEAHSNLGNTLKELRRLDEAEASYNQAIALKPEFALAHNNLGNTLQELGRFAEAEVSCLRALALNSEFAEAHNNLGITLKELGRLDEAEASYNQAIALKPDYAQAHNNLGVALKELGRLDEAEESCLKAIALKPDYVEALYNLSIVQRYMNNLKAEIISLQNVLQIDFDNFGLRAGVNLAIQNFLEGSFDESKKHLLATTKIQEKTSLIFKNEKVYWKYLLNILKWHENRYLSIKRESHDKNLYVIGESHSLASHHLRIQNSGIDFFCSARLIKGCKQWHLGNAFRNQYKHQFERIFFALPKHSHVLLAIGEIDCRLDTGIIEYKNKFPEKKIKEIILNTVESYLTYIVNNNFSCQHKVIIQGIPCPNIDVRNHSDKDIKQLVEVIKIFNYELKIQSKEKGFKFLDTHELTNKGDGLSNSSWHIDDYHLSPEGMQEAWQGHISG
jgi:tetratricopeptide (TPR) repeat protein